jgi:hypothetical protein
MLQNIDHIMVDNVYVKPVLMWRILTEVQREYLALCDACGINIFLQSICKY